MERELSGVQAFTDGAVGTDGQAGWGVWFPGSPDLRMHGVVNTRDIMVAEIWAVLMAVKRAPEQTPLTVRTDAQTLPDLLAGRSRDRVDLNNLLAKIRTTGHRRGVALTVCWNARDTPDQNMAHHLAVSGRTRGPVLKDLARVTVRPTPSGEVNVEVIRATGRTTKESSLLWRLGTASADLHAALTILDKLKQVELRVDEAGNDRFAAQVLRALQTEVPQLGFMLRRRSALAETPQGAAHQRTQESTPDR